MLLDIHHIKKYQFDTTFRYNITLNNSSLHHYIASSYSVYLQTQGMTLSQKIYYIVDKESTARTFWELIYSFNII